jgi:hypothetical protein
MCGWILATNKFKYGNEKLKGDMNRLEKNKTKIQKLRIFFVICFETAIILIV